jgi:1-acyl-sn-glycerol-3-phosphate acyltransferase
MSEATPEQRRDDIIRAGVWKVLYFLADYAVCPAVRGHVIEHVEFPRKGPLLLVSNHPSPWDPITVPWSAERQVHNLGTDQLLRVPYFGWMMPYFSMIPFKKGMKDPTALAEVERRVRRGDCALIFAEGDRTWTGRSNPIKPGIGRMIKRLGVPVGFVRITTGHMQWPRWAAYPRSVPYILEHRALIEYPESATPEQITADVAHYISVDPYEVEVPKRSWGKRLAVGLSTLMWACPVCYALGSLGLVSGDDDAVQCSACESRWRVDLGCWMRREGGRAEDIHVDAAYRRIVDHFGALPIVDPARYARDGLALEAEAELSRIHYGQVEAEQLGVGHLELFRDRFVFTDHRGHAPLVLHFDPIQAVLLQVGNKLQVRTAEDNFQISPVSHSTLLWKHFIDRHLEKYRGHPSGGGGGE